MVIEDYEKEVEPSAIDELYKKVTIAANEAREEEIDDNCPLAKTSKETL